MQDRPVVSVCIQTYQHAPFIRECLESIISQKTDFKFEIILGEDASTDGTREICIEYASRYPELIKLNLRLRKDVIFIDGKPTGRFNFMENIKQASGKYIALCEGDDYWIDDCKLQKQVDFLEKNKEYSICFHNAKVLQDGKFTLFKPSSQFKDVYTLEDTFKMWFIPTASILLRVPENFTFPSWFTLVYSGDRSLISIVASTGKIKYMDELMSVYRILSSGRLKSTPRFKRIKSTIFLLEQLNAHFNYKYSELIDKEIKKWMVAYTLSGGTESIGIAFKLLKYKLKLLFTKSTF